MDRPEIKPARHRQQASQPVTRGESDALGGELVHIGRVHARAALAMKVAMDDDNVGVLRRDGGQSKREGCDAAKQGFTRHKIMRDIAVNPSLANRSLLTDFLQLRGEFLNLFRMLGRQIVRFARIT